MKWLNCQENKIKNKKINDVFEIKIIDDTNHHSSSLCRTYPVTKYPIFYTDAPIGISPFIHPSYWKRIKPVDESNSSTKSNNNSEEEKKNISSGLDNSVKIKTGNSESIKEISPFKTRRSLEDSIKEEKARKKPRGSGYCENCLEKYTDLYIVYFINYSIWKIKNIKKM